MDNTETTTPANTTETPNTGPWRTPTAHELLEELRLGIAGRGTHADSERLAKAKKVLEDFEQESDRAYAAAQWPEEPWLFEPFGAKLLVHHGGNLSAVLSDPSLEKEVITAMGLDQYEQRIPDEDGGREEWVYPAETEEGLKEIADMMAALHDALAAERAVGAERVLNWARQHEPGLYDAYHETFRYVGEEEARAETLTKLTDRAYQHGQRALEEAQERANGIATMIALGRPDLVDIAGRTGLDTVLNAENITPRLITALEEADAADSRYEDAALTGFSNLEQVELWDEEGQAPYTVARVVLDKEISDLQLSEALTEAVGNASGHPSVFYEEPMTADIVRDQAAREALYDADPAASEEDIRFRLSLDAYDLRRAAFEALGMTESVELLPGQPLTGDTLRLDQLRRKDGTTPGPDEANAYDMVVGDPEPEVTLGIKDWAQRGYRALPGTLRPTLENAPKTQPVRSANINTGSVIITPEGDRQNVLSAKRQGLNVKITFSSNINPSEQETLTVPAYRRLHVEQPTAGNTPQEHETRNPQPDHHQEVIHTTQTSSPGLS